jgi:hypothetical protein
MNILRYSLPSEVKVKALVDIFVNVNTQTGDIVIVVNQFEYLFTVTLPANLFTANHFVAT